MKKVGCRSPKRLWREGGARLLVCVAALSAQPLRLLPVRAIEAPDRPLPAEVASAGVTRFSFIAYGDTRGQADGRELAADHGRVVDAMLDCRSK
jgi:hypothetical protein